MTADPSFDFSEGGLTLETVSNSSGRMSSCDEVADVPLLCHQAAAQPQAVELRDVACQTTAPAWPQSGLRGSKYCSRPPALPPQPPRSPRRCLSSTSSCGASTESTRASGGTFSHGGDGAAEGDQAEPSSLDGHWVLCNHRGEASWLEELVILGDDVVDGDGRRCCLVRADGATLLEGGTLHLGEGLLSRAGKSGRRQVYARMAPEIKACPTELLEDVSIVRLAESSRFDAAFGADVSRESPWAEQLR